VTDPTLDELLAFYGIEQDDLDLLAMLRAPLEAAADDAVDEFYRHLLQNPATQNLLRNDEVRGRLLASQRDYLLSLANPEIDSAYVADRESIGTTHERIGLDTQWYLGAYALYFQLLLPMVREAMRSRGAADEERAIAALAKRLLFDANLAIGQYLARREADLRHLNSELTAASRALTREVGETKNSLEVSQARAQAAERLASVATLVTGLAHEIGTPMGVLRGHAESLESAVESERDQWRLRMILEQIDRITSIIHSLLNIARPRESLRVPVAFDELVATSVGFLAEKLKRRGVRVETELAPGVQVQGDPERLQQVLLNLFINAIDAMPEGGVLRVEVVVPDGDEVCVRIEDTGTGIVPEAMPHLFDPFFTTKAAGHGSGLGLVVVKGIIEEHGGEISAETEVGKGTCFKVCFPAGSTEPEG
jgi:signal transduction histidine kinase